MDEESIEGSSEETVEEPIVTEETPSEPVETETPAETVETVETTEPEVALYELPDGRKVDAETLSREWKENFMPDYTKKAQELAAVKAPITEQKPTNPLEDPEYIPATYAELAQQIKADTIRELEEKENAAIQARKAIEDTVTGQLTELKALDPSLNENALFGHATKYGFRDLKMAHQNMRDMNETIKQVQKTTADNIAKRSDPVSVSPGATGARPDPSAFSSSIEYLRSLK